MAGNNRLNAPIVILGAPRSGTTLLGTVLSVHPHLAYADEPRLVWRYGNDRKSDMLEREDARPAVIRHIRGYFDRVVADAGKQRLLEKTPANSLRPAFVDAVLPDCLFIHITRSPIDSVLSIRRFWRDHARGVRGGAPGRVSQRFRELSPARLPYYSLELLRRMAPAPLSRIVGQNIWGPRIPGMQRLLRDLDLLDVCALQWRMCVEMSRHFGDRLPTHRYLEIRLEDMSPQVLRQVMEFCELEDDAAVAGRFEQDFDPSMAGKRRTEADPRDIERILRWVEPTMRWLGYEPPA